MKGTAIVLFFISAILLWGALKYFLDIKRPGIYPPKQMLKKRAVVLAGAGSASLLLAVLLSYF
ncbi:hypothetical protein HPT25_13405 [Bacillus sp. BRMEA1]|uniref:hypothetical protein n=1 Tax=Neobacillus endophyticus TaxID=2738405 RepID=UPI001567A181|nr:hypothetical protein [Neobacillus endophyticus]NRD78363.1 hypothetical protein [Neobacillus endophyticus]